MPLLERCAYKGQISFSMNVYRWKNLVMNVFQTTSCVQPDKMLEPGSKARSNVVLLMFYLCWCLRCAGCDCGSSAGSPASSYSPKTVFHSGTTLTPLHGVTPHTAELRRPDSTHTFLTEAVRVSEQSAAPGGQRSGRTACRRAAPGSCHSDQRVVTCADILDTLHVGHVMEGANSKRCLRG